MSKQLLDYTEEEERACKCTKPGDICDLGLYDPESESIYDNTPLQEQVEQQDRHIFQLEDALSKSVDVIAALMGERKDLHDQLYQAQVDAQDWQNKYNEAGRLLKTGNLRICDAEQIRELTNEVQSLRRDLETAARETDIVVERFVARIDELTELNTQLELRNERQGEMISRAKWHLSGGAFED